MPLVLASVVDPKVKRVEGSFVNLHKMPGGHSRDQLTKSLRLRIIELKKSEEAVYVKVQLKNSGAGHAVPTGSPSRKVVLSLRAETSGQAEPIRAQKVYQRLVLDSEGQPILKDSRLIIDGVKVASDNRIGPGEERIEEFFLPVSGDGNYTIRATLTYLYSPHNRPETETRIDFFSEERKLLAHWKR